MAIQLSGNGGIGHDPGNDEVNDEVAGDNPDVGAGISVAIGVGTPCCRAIMMSVGFWM